METTTSPTYDPDLTEYRQAAARCGLRIKRKFPAASSVLLLDEASMAVVYDGSEARSWEYFRDVCGLAIGAH